MQILLSTPLCPRWQRLGAALSLFAASTSLALAQAVPAPAVATGSSIPTATVSASVSGISYVLDGVVQAVKQSTVAAQATGRITRFNVKAGDHVRAGQVLVSIDDREAQVGAQHAQAQINQAEADLRNAQAQSARTRTLQSQGFVSQAALDTTEAQLQSAKAQRAQAEASLRQSGLSQGYTQVTAPLDGWVLQTFAQAGDLAVPGTPLLVVYAPQPLRAVVQVPASRNAAVRQSQQTTVWVDGDTPQGIKPLNRLEVPSSDPVSQTTEWRLDLPAKEAAHLLPGQQVRVAFAGASNANSHTAQRLLVPAAAVVRRGELSAVYVASSQGFALRAVRLGANQGAGLVEVLSGLRAGEVVATDPLRAAQASAASVNK
jgi:RND family efflux transporter MFP subunit